MATVREARRRGTAARRTAALGAIVLAVSAFVALAGPTPAGARAGGGPQGPAAVARSYLSRVPGVAGAFGSTADFRLDAVAALSHGDRAVRFQQLADGVPVYDGQLVVQLDAAGSLLSVTGETAPDVAGTPRTVTAAAARRVALAAVERRPATAGWRLTASAAVAYVFDPLLIGDPDTGTRAVWQVYVTGPPASGITVEVLVDARTGAVARVIDRTERLNRSLCDDANSRTTNVADGSWCSPNVVTDEYLAAVDGSHPQALKAYNELGAVSTFYRDVLGVDLTQQVGLDLTDPPPARTDPVLTATVRYCAHDGPCPLANSFWSDAAPGFVPGDGAVYPGGQAFLGDGLANAPDILPHEVTHGVTASVNGLDYVNESGAINESMSDLFGELTQLYDPTTHTFVNARDPHWLIGEKLDGPSLYGAIRSMSNPSSTALPSGEPQPNRVTSRYWAGGSADGGGLHTNDGVGNKTAYLIARGGTFNGYRVTGIGDLATAQLYWRVQNLLTPGANYRDLAADLSIACSALFGRTSSRCASVRAATGATEIAKSTVSVTARSTVVTYGHATTLSARLLSARHGGMYVRASEGVRLTLERRDVGSSRWAVVGTRTASTAGRAAWSVRPTRNEVYLVRYRGSAGLGLVASHGGRAVSVRPSFTRRVDRTLVRRGGSFVISGSMRPARPGSLVELQRRTHGHWRTVSSARLSAGSRYRIRYRATGLGAASYRIYRPKASTTAAGWSARITIRAT